MDTMCNIINKIALLDINSHDTLDVVLQDLGGIQVPVKSFHREVYKLLRWKNVNIKVYECTDCVQTNDGWIQIQALLAKRLDHDTLVLINKTKWTAHLFQNFPQGYAASWMALYKDNYILVGRDGGANLIQQMMARERDGADATYSYDCNVCMEQFVATVVRFQCRHLFCVSCTDKMEQCPLCRAKPHPYQYKYTCKNNKKTNRSRKGR